MMLMTFAEMSFARRRALCEDTDQQHACEDAVQCTATTEDRDPAEQHRRDDLTAPCPVALSPRALPNRSV